MTDPGDIIGIGSRGEGMTRDGRFIPFAVPGDHVDGHGQVTAGADHRVPPCRHYPVCGGCQLQHVSDAAYGQFLTDRIARALSAKALSAPTEAPHLSPPKARRRAVLRAQRNGAGVTIGFNAAGSHDVVDLAECHILDPALWVLIAPLRTLIATITSGAKPLTIVLTLVDQGVDVLIEGAIKTGPEPLARLAQFAEQHALARLAIDTGDGPEMVAFSGAVTVTLGRHVVSVPFKPFLQATVDGERTLIDAVTQSLSGVRAGVDLFAGLGTFALTVPGIVHAVEGSRDAALALGATRVVSVEHRDLFRRPLTPSELKRFDAAILDPPRAGAIDQVKQIAASAIKRVAYVSCNPATFARDAAILCEGGFAIERIKPVGQFRWSTHVELAACFTRSR
jgi:23S rRNA (uracil1939-C5)-methyltransferase